MQWLTGLLTGHSVAQSLTVLCLAIVLGLAFGRIRLFGISLGVGGVLFSGIALSHFGLRVDGEILHFVREFGLILFVFTVGLQVGPGFVDSLRRRGVVLNVAAGAVVVLGVLIAAGLFFALDLPLPVVAGVMSGAVTNTPSLAAVSEVFGEIDPATASEAAAEAGRAYAMTYPFGIVGIILAMLILRRWFRIDPEAELEELHRRDASEHPSLEGKTFVVSNPGIFGLTLGEFMKLAPEKVVVSRMREASGQSVRTAAPNMRLMKDAELHAVGSAEQLAKMQALVGTGCDHTLSGEEGRLERRVLMVTKSGVAGKPVSAYALTPDHGVTVTRIVRSGVEFTAGPGVNLHYGDSLVCVGESGALDRAASIVGNSQKELDHPHLLPIFLGILLGIVLGSIPFPVPGLPSGLKLGLAGGPLIMAIVLSRMNNFAGMVWYLPMGGNLVFRETGISLFLACVGLNAGAGFVETLLSSSGLLWIAAGACVTFIPLIVVSFALRIRYKADYASLCGFLGGSMTDPPALAFSVQMLKSDAPASVYAGVYPFTMLLRILTAQILILVLHRLASV